MQQPTEKPLKNITSYCMSEWYFHKPNASDNAGHDVVMDNKIIHYHSSGMSLLTQSTE